MLARRRPLAALTEPRYDMSDVPRFNSSHVEASVVQRCTRRILIESMAELLLLCNEALERTKNRAEPGRRRVGLKPLSIEYIADRLATDDPLFGYLVRERARGWLQGFITLTVFTTFVKNFRFDSLHEQAEIVDDEGAPIDGRDRAVDARGDLSDELQREVHAGDVHGEGVIWPHVAELSLLGGLGAGGWLVRLVIDELESKPASEMQYNWLVLEATDNSVTFYEAHGFVRVGAVASHVESNAEAKELRAQGDAAERNGFQRSATEWHIVSETEAETPASIAARSGGRFVAADIAFLNAGVFRDLAADTPLAPGVQLRVPRALAAAPAREGGDADAAVREELAQRRAARHTCCEDDRPRDVAEQLGVSVSHLVRLNKRWYSGLTAGAQLMEGTVLRVPPKPCEATALPLDCDSDLLAYRHWTFANDAIEFKEGSKMMVRRLRSSVGAGGVTATSPLHQLPRLARDAPVAAVSTLTLAPLNPTALVGAKRARRHPVRLRLAMDPRTWPARPASLPDSTRTAKRLRVRVRPLEGDVGAGVGGGGLLRGEAVEVRAADLSPALLQAVAAPFLVASVPALCRGINTPLRVRLRGAGLSWGGGGGRGGGGWGGGGWDGGGGRSGSRRAPLLLERTRHTIAFPRPNYPRAVARVRVSFPHGAQRAGFWPPMIANLPLPPPKRSLVNKIVRVRSLVRSDGAVRATDDNRWRYYFAMTYIPDLEWLHLAPLCEVGVFGPERGLALRGRVRWKLVPEGKGTELHISAHRCVLHPARSICRTRDADAEEWVIGSVCMG